MVRTVRPAREMTMRSRTRKCEQMLGRRSIGRLGSTISRLGAGWARGLYSPATRARAAAQGRRPARAAIAGLLREKNQQSKVHKGGYGARYEPSSS